MSAISTLSIQGFKSIRKLDSLELRPLNVLIGPNGAGKSNFISFFRMHSELIAGRFQLWVQKQGGADRIVSFGIKETKDIIYKISFDDKAYSVSLLTKVDDQLIFSSEKFHGVDKGLKVYFTAPISYESYMARCTSVEVAYNNINFFKITMSCWKIFHFHDTSETAGMRRFGSLHDQTSLRSDGSNLAAYLWLLRESHPDVYAMIRKTVTLAAPFFDDFVLNPRQLPTGEEQIQLLWRQKGSDYPLWPSQLSDGTLRFICLVTALSQPEPPSTILIDEPELGLHPYAITLLGALLRTASKRMQVIVSTQSVPLINEFSIDDLLIVEREEGNTVFRRHTQESFAAWLESYSVGDLWMKNLLGGRPRA
ncbi:MAG: AAA family ATPase [Magnetococcales bacterium]|nr:AAA family ATPase [Magnetococcales bacterium]